MDHVKYYNPYDRYRQRFWQRIAGFVIVIILMLVFVGLGFVLGQQTVRQRDNSMEQQLAVLTKERDALRESFMELKAEAQTATVRFQQLQQSYDQKVPEGPIEDLIALVHKQIDEGMQPDRLAFLIRSARPPRNCTEPETVRFVPKTPAYKGADSIVSLADGAVSIKGQGFSALNDKGEPQAWFDPTKSVEIEFTFQDGKTQKKQGILPLYHTMVIGAREYRLGISEGAKSFAKIVYDSCDYP